MPIRTAVMVSVLFAATLAAGGARAQGTYFTKAQVLRSFFADCEKVESRHFLVTPSLREAYRADLGGPLRDTALTLYVGLRAGQVAGWAYVGEERGQHEPITYAALVAPDGSFQRLEIMIYREAHGEGVRQARFRDQFKGRRPGQPLRLGHEIDAISGATISSRAMTTAVQHTLWLVRHLTTTKAGDL